MKLNAHRLLQVLRVLLIVLILVLIARPLLHYYRMSQTHSLNELNKLDVTSVTSDQINIQNSYIDYSQGGLDLTADDALGFVEEVFRIAPSADMYIGGGGIYRMVTLQTEEGDEHEALLFESMRMELSPSQLHDGRVGSITLTGGYQPMKPSEDYLGYLTVTTAKLSVEGRLYPVYRGYLEGTSVYPLDGDYETQTVSESYTESGRLIDLAFDHIYQPLFHNEDEDLALRDLVFKEYAQWEKH